MKRLQFTLLLAIPLCWFFFKLLPAFTQPAACSTANFMYAENMEQYKIWFFQADNFQIQAFDDSSNFLYVLTLWFFIHFLKLTTIKAAYTISSISIFISVYLIQRIIDSRFWSIHLLLVGLLFMSTQIWAGVLGDEILFQGMLWLFAVRSFWKHRYSWLMFWSVVNIVARPDNLFFVLPMIIVSYYDVRDLKERYKRGFIKSRIRKTILFLFAPLAVFYFYRYAYFQTILPHNWLHQNERMDTFFHLDAWNFLKHYLRYFVAPLAIGVVFYFIKEYKSLHARYFALAVCFIIIPSIYTCTYAQTENLAFKNYYVIFLGLIVLSMLFIRDFRSISQGITTAIFVFFFGFQTAFAYFEKTLQSDFDNMYYVANDLSAVRNGKLVAYYDNFVSWIGNWQSIFANGNHTKQQKKLSTNEILALKADVILADNTTPISAFKNDYHLFQLPASTRQFEKQSRPENSLDLFFYKYAHKTPIYKKENVSILVLKNSKNYKEIEEHLVLHAGKIIW